VQPEKPEHTRRLLGRCPIRPGEHRADRSGLIVPHCEHIQPLLAGQTRGQVRDTRVRTRGDTFRGDAQRQGQTRTVAREFTDGVPFGVHPIRTDDCPQQIDRFPWGELVQRDAVRAFTDDQAGKQTTAGYQHQTCRRVRQQRTDLIRGGGIVQQHQHPTVSQHRSIYPGHRLHVMGNRGPGHTKSAEKSLQRLCWVQRRVRAVTTEVDRQLPVRKMAANLMRPVHGKRGLAHPSGPGDRGNHDSGPEAGRRSIVEKDVQLAQFLTPTSEEGNVRWQQRRPHRNSYRGHAGDGDLLDAAGLHHESSGIDLDFVVCPVVSVNHAPQCCPHSALSASNTTERAWDRDSTTGRRISQPGRGLRTGEPVRSPEGDAVPGAD
jgi:hypothetical protein